MTLFAHLAELRTRLLVTAGALLVAAIAGFISSDWLLAALRTPIDAAPIGVDGMSGLNFTYVTQAFDLRIQIALTFAVIASSPVWLYQLWAFIVPGLVRRERRYVLGFLGAAIPLFLLGCAAGAYVTPHVVAVMLSFVAPQDSALLDARSFYDFVLRFTLATGIAFVLPVFLVVLNFLGLMPARTILKNWRIAVLLVFVFAAVATPAADVLSMFILAGPMIALYFGAAGVAALHDRNALGGPHARRPRVASHGKGVRRARTHV